MFTLEEAIAVANLSFTFEPIDMIYKRMEDSHLSIEKLQELLESCVKKGTICYKTVEDEKLYANAMLIIGIFEYQVNRLTMEFMDLMKQIVLHLLTM